MHESKNKEGKMSAPLSTDLRKRALALYDEKKLNKKEICSLLKIDPKTLYNWVTIRNLKGNVQPKIPPKRRASAKIKDSEKFIKFVEKNPNCTQEELAKKWGGVSKSTIARSCKKFGLVYKKKALVIKNEMKRSA